MSDRPILRKTKIVATVGPACDDVATLVEMIRAGMNVARLNFSHEDHESHRERLERVREAAAAASARVALLIESGAVYDQLKGVVIDGAAELVRDSEAVTDILVRVNARSVDGMQDANADQIRAAVAGTAKKRTGIRIRPQKIVSWDHSKLGGTY